MTNISSWAIRRPIPTLVLFLLLTLVGIQSFMKLPVNANPRVDFPIVTVSIVQAGAAPAELETQVTRRVEGAISGLAGIRHIQSTIGDGLSTTTVEFQLGIDTARATNDVRQAVSQIRSEMPRDIEEPTIASVDVEGGAILYFAVRAPQMSPVDLSWFVDETIGRELLTTKGVQRVQRIGGVSREITVQLDPDQLIAFGINAEDINNQVQAFNTNVPGGRSRLNEKEQSIRAVGGAITAAELAERPISLPNGQWTTLATLGKVTDGEAEPRELSRLDGEPVVGFSVFRAKGSSDTAVEDAVNATIARLVDTYPGVQIDRVLSTVDYTRASDQVAMETLIEGAALTVVVVFLFLGDWRATLIAAVAMPLSILPTFAVMLWFDFTLNSITLLALTLVIGILVDDAIVEVENIDRHLHMGKRPFQASIDAADQIGFAVLAITATIVAVFLPVSFIGGVIGQYFKQFGLTVSVAVLASMLVARLVTPLMAAYILVPKAVKHEDHAVPKSRMGRGYVALLELALRHRLKTCGIGVLVLVGSFLLVPLLPSGFLPSDDRSLSRILIELPPDSTLRDTDSAVQSVTAALREMPEVKSVFASIGRTDDGPDVARASLLVNLVPASERTLSQRQFELGAAGLIARTPNIRFAFQNENAARDISIILVGDEPEKLAIAALAVEAGMRGIEGIANVQTTEPLPRTELQIRPRFDEAARLGVSTQSIAAVTRIATTGDTDANSAKFNIGDRQVPIRVMIDRGAQSNLDTLGMLRVSVANGSLPLMSVADLSVSEGPGQLNRFDRQRRVTISADLAGIPLGVALERINALDAVASLPAGVRQVQYGDAEYIGEMFQSFSAAMLFGLLMVLAVLIVLFKDFLQPITILVALPLSVGGAIVGLLLYGGALDLPAVIGLLMLMGIVTKNSILLVEFAIEKRNGGLSRQRALVESGVERARPIIMTTLAMVAGMMPAALGVGADAGFRAPMAIAVIGGLITSTLLSLVFVPVVFTYMDDLRGWLGRRLQRLTSVTAADRAGAECQIAEGEAATVQGQG
ncbi:MULTISPECIES: efflux RND transporter permease subunit [Rhizobium/Agrobacterium group]|uniref:efflux RND transporter permease subunit n=1 Tax=Rhizobium/Agrobacterium group TaxID=227290 RepID=UPI00107EFE17|nr:MULTISPECIES: efflux RND transporter permease subunit [Rhizobium/Agrobacterium group]MBB4399740.1 multidrug efflux pump subunit AcrB [Agrobacterium radiobacter]MBB5585895.1 multidrug efflux pump subunit AcrB [Agrobacterium radiobacter]TGE92289.1 ABC transporter permease [Rhizobium sp. SEMIA 4032]